MRGGFSGRGRGARQRSLGGRRGAPHKQLRRSFFGGLMQRRLTLLRRLLLRDLLRGRFLYWRLLCRSFLLRGCLRAFFGGLLFIRGGLLLLRFLRLRTARAARVEVEQARRRELVEPAAKALVLLTLEKREDRVDELRPTAEFSLKHP